ncbi:GNAT family N-acetyltransferase [Glaciihabitans sp. INWT7]|uniref:GNAT family N-acetyltransferase n=1 Tax=Glaciihabitans sp. INWT7 TaxID=2596912 RepID=UPI001629010D|nr:GNAT family N-acetyltransferase [Glaciihabitans sp. INWT7]QNE46158.1 GNAT family N-acetyltransferase [Glaciihabitans sp. INWT7]
MTVLRIADAAAAAIGFTSDSIAGQEASPLLSASTLDPDLAAQSALARYLDETPHSSGWVALDDSGSAVAVLAAQLELADENHPGYTYMPPAYAYVPLSCWGVSSAYDGEKFLPQLVEQVAKDARELGIHRLLVQTRPHDWVAGGLWRQLGLMPDTILAGRRSTPPLAVSDDIDIRTVTGDDEDALVSLAFEEHDYHALNTGTGTRANQVVGPTRRAVREWIDDQAAGTDNAFVAVNAAGQVVGSIALHTVTLPSESPGRNYYPALYGYIGLTSVTAEARGHGVGRALTARALTTFAARGIEHVLLHYVDDNSLSRPFWNRMGFSPLVVTLGGDIL